MLVVRSATREVWPISSFGAEHAHAHGGMIVHERGVNQRENPQCAGAIFMATSRAIPQEGCARRH
nr:hypothetical protein [uncultured bacterium]